MTPTKESWNEIFALIDEQSKLGRVVIENEEGLYTIPIEQMCSQDASGILYDTNRLEEVTKAIKSKRSVNDIAMAKIVRYLKERTKELETALAKYKEKEG